MKAGDPSYPTPTSAAVSKVMKGNRKTGSRPEVMLARVLHSRGLRYRKNKPVATRDGVVRPDLVFSGPRVAVFVDGCFWHSCPIHGNTPRTNTAYWGAKLRKNAERDRLVTAALSSDGWTVLRVWEHEPVEKAADSVVAGVRSSAARHGLEPAGGDRLRERPTGDQNGPARQRCGRS